MKKLLLSLVALLATVGAWADFDQTYVNATPWVKYGFVAPEGVSANLESGWTIGMSETPIAVSGGVVTVVFDWIGDSNVASCGLNILGVDLIDPATLKVVASDYKKGKDSASTRPSYSLTVLSAGNYILRYFVQENGGNEALIKTGGTVHVTGATVLGGMPVAGRFYRIKGQNTARPYVGYTLSGSNIEVKADAVDAGIYYVEPVAGESTKGKLVNFQTGLYFSNGNPATLSMSNDNITFHYDDSKNPKVGVAYKMQVNDGNYVFNNTNDNDRNNETYVLHEGHATAASEKYFTFEPVASLPVTIGESGYATFFAPVAVTLLGLEAYYVSEKDDNVAKLALVGNVIPANTGVVLKGTAGETYTLTIGGNANAVSNLLEGTVADTYVAKNAYVLAQPKDNTVGFYLAEMNQSSGAAFLNNGFKAYLPAEAASVRFISFDFGTETAIESVESVENNAVVYDLAGRRVQGAQKGIFIVNGKKVIK